LVCNVLAPEQFGPLKIKTHCIICTNSLAPQTMSVEQVQLKFQAPAPPSINFYSGSSHPNCLGSGSTALVSSQKCNHAGCIHF